MELLVALVVMSIIGAGLVRLMASQSQFFGEQESAANARRVARSGLNLMFSDLRRVETDSGVVTANPTTLSVRLPYWVGISCGSGGGFSGTHIAMSPVDSLVLADAGYSGYGYIDKNNIPHFVTGGTLSGGNGSVCKGEGIETVAHPRANVIQISPAIAAAPAGTPVFLWQNVTYWFGSSVTVSGRRGLFRTIGAKTLTEEIAAPFDNTAAFAYFVPGSGAPVSNPAAGTPILGVDLGLIGLNQRSTNGGTQQARFETSLYFQNR